VSPRIAIVTGASRGIGGKSITVNAIAPGPTATDLFLDGKPPGRGLDQRPALRANGGMT
jgi:NAD(P)-dependent dehydrogenase (short-subunit alcohol dehydrogenase family)